MSELRPGSVDRNVDGNDSLFPSLDYQPGMGVEQNLAELAAKYGPWDESVGVGEGMVGDDLFLQSSTTALRASELPVERVELSLFPVEDVLVPLDGFSR